MRTSWLALIIVLGLGSTTALPDQLQDDAGSGRDAPDAPIPDVHVIPGMVYEGRLLADDLRDWYAFNATTGDEIEATAAGLGCFDIARPDGSVAASDCTHDLTGRIGRLRLTLDESGTWFFQYQGAGLDAYRFSLGLNEAAPDPLPAWAALADVGGVHQDDAGTGRDAPAFPRPQFHIETGYRYDGTLGGDGLQDIYDHYAFTARIGDTIHLTTSGIDHCTHLLDTAGETLGSSCSRATVLNGTITHDAEYSGTYYALIQYDTPLATPDLYRFGIGLNEEVAL